MADLKIRVALLPIYKKWVAKQTNEVQEKILEYTSRIEEGNTSNLKGLSGGIIEIKIHYGAGVRVYLKKKDENCYIVLWGGTNKKSQQSDIDKAIKIKQNWEADENEKNENKS
ncbi:MAG: type II toxin-antitoxin system RelE/ParE family toxin [Elusimicrobiota bacterium]|jgi:putative addiction module killer protein|nr:type II toxin-antitoxin system RelE/ParE family toxin [Elusimicrobiota bacterium]